MLVLILVLGIYPNLIFQVTDPAMTAMGDTFQALGQ
jgi:NADH:ubiquinone oxidoreductase subunit 4 (subunit M)